MPSLGQLLSVYCLFILLASMLGGFLPTLFKLSHIRLQSIMSFVSGFMLGIATLHLIPFAIDYGPSIQQVVTAMLAGILVMFFLLRIFHVHHHGEIDDEQSQPCDHLHPHDHADNKQHRLSWIGLSFGLGVHTLLDGVALAAMVRAESSHREGWVPAGFGMFLAVLLHKPLDALSITSLMRAGGWSREKQLLVNFGFALTCPVGALLFFFGMPQFVSEESFVLGYALGFSAGFFLCIALGDLLPEVQFHSHDRFWLSFWLLFGVAAAIGVEASHKHDYDVGVPVYEKKAESAPIAAAQNDQDSIARPSSIGR